MSTDTDSDTTEDSIDRADIRRAIREAIEAREEPTTRTIIDVAAQTTGAGRVAVSDEIDELEQHGFVYRYETDGAEVVKLP